MIVNYKIEIKDKLMIQECFNNIKKKYKEMEQKLKLSNGEIVLNGNQDLEKLKFFFFFTIFIFKKNQN